MRATHALHVDPLPRAASALLLAACLGAAAPAARGQDVVFTQFYAAPLLLNPGFAGTTRAPNVTLNHRSRYVGFAGTVPYQTYALQYSQYVAPLRSGVGVSVVADDAGDGLYGTTSALAHYAYGIRIDDEHTVRLGLSAGLERRRLDWDRLVFFDQLDVETGGVDAAGNPNPTSEQRPESASTTYADFGAGVLYAGPSAYAGLALAHLTTPDDRVAALGDGGFYGGLPIRLSVHAGYQLDIAPARSRDRYFLTPNVLYTRQGPFEQLNLGAYVSLGRVFAGAWFRHAFGNPDAAIGSVGVEWGMYKLGYSYDATVSGLAAVNSGTHEISLNLNFDEAWWVKRKRRDDRYNDCLNLFR